MTELSLEIDRARDKLDIESDKFNRLKSQIAKARDPMEREDLQEQLEYQRAARDACEVPRPERIIASDVTPEALASLLASCGGRLAILDSEGGIFAGLSRYQRSGIPNADALLKSYTGDAINVDRKGSDPIQILQPAITMGLTVQPAVLEEVRETAALVGRGLLARPLYCLPGDNIGSRTSPITSPEVSERVESEYSEGLMRLLSMPADTPRVLTVSEAAIGVLNSWYAVTESRQGPGGDLHHLREWAGKLVGTTCRLAGLLHLAWGHCGDEIDSATMHGAVQLAGVFSEHAKMALGDHEDREAARGMREVLAAAQRHQSGGMVGRRQIQQAVKRTIKAGQLDELLAAAVALGYLRREGTTLGVHPRLAEFVPK